MSLMDNNLRMAWINAGCYAWLARHCLGQACRVPQALVAGQSGGPMARFKARLLRKKLQAGNTREP
jgi:hypothetical protein